MRRLFLTGILTAAVAGMAYPGVAGAAAIPLKGDPTYALASGQQATSGQQTSGQQATGQQQTGEQATKKAAPKAKAGKQAAGEKAAAGTNLGTIRLPKKVTANGEPLAAGSYQVRLTDETAKPAAGETPESERWVEFLQGGKVKGRELASVIPDSEIAQVSEGPGKPAKGGHRVDLLKTEKYWRVWINKGGNNYLIHLPPEGGSGKTAK